MCGIWWLLCSWNEKSEIQSQQRKWDLRIHPSCNHKFPKFAYCDANFANVYFQMVLGVLLPWEKAQNWLVWIFWHQILAGVGHNAQIGG